MLGASFISNLIIHYRVMKKIGAVCFDYKIKPGISETRNAIKLLEISGFPKKIYKDAEEFYNHFKALLYIAN